MTIRIGFLGTNFSKVHAKAAQQLLGVELAAVGNHQRKSMAQFSIEFNIPHQFDTIEEMVTSGCVDAVVVASPNYLHASQTITALKAGLPVLVEKPMALNSIEAERMVETSEQFGVFLMVAHCFRFQPEIQWLRQQVVSGNLGEMIRAKAYGFDVGWVPQGWFTQKQLAGGGALIDMGVHVIDSVRYLLGDPAPQFVLAKVGTYFWDIEVDDSNVLLIQWNNGVISYIESGWCRPPFDRRGLSVQLDGSLGFGGVQPTFLKSRVLAEEGHEEITPDFQESSEDLHQKMYVAQMAYFIQAIGDGKQTASNGLTSLTNMKIIDAAYQSAQTTEMIRF